MRRQHAVAIFLSPAGIAELFGRRRVVDIAVRVAGDEGTFVGRHLLDVEPNLHGQFPRESEQHEIPDSQSHQLDVEGSFSGG